MRTIALYGMGWLLGIMPALCFSQGPLYINELYYDTDKKSQEWIELNNPSQRSVDLNKWSIRDSRKKVVLCTYSQLLPANSYIVLTSIKMPDSVRQIVNSSLPEWNNSGDDVVLYDADGRISDSLAYSSDWGGHRFISLERLSWEQPSNDPDNWATCIDPGGHTAGRRNSVHAPESTAKISLSISPSPFSPDQDGFEDQTVVTYALPMTHAIIHIKIYDAMGRLVRYLCNTESSGPQGSKMWDGTADNGQHCRMGVYVIYMQAIDELAGRVEQAKGVCVLAERL